MGSTRRLRTIYNTNKRTARASGRWQRIQKTKDRFPYLEYRKSLSENKRLDHKLYYGLVLPVDSPIWKEIFPPNGYGCKCRTRQLTAKEAEALGISDDFELEFEDFENPRTGKTIQVPKGIEPSFAHNHDRLTAIINLAKEKHSQQFADNLQQLARQEKIFAYDVLKKDIIHVADADYLLEDKEFVAKYVKNSLLGGRKAKWLKDNEATVQKFKAN